MADLDPVYDADYYRSHCGKLPYDRSEPAWAQFFANVASQLIDAFSPNTVFDAGCAHGFLMEAFWHRGVEARGRDISHFAISQVRQDIREYAEQGSLTETISGKYDLVTCIEVLEHMTEDDGRRALAHLCSASDLVLFSSSPDDFEEPTHINVRPTLWWLQRFAEQGFAPVEEHSASYLTWHAFVVRRTAASISADRLTAFAQKVARQKADHQHRLLEATLHDLRAAKDEADRAHDAKVAELSRDNLSAHHRIKQLESELVKTAALTSEALEQAEKLRQDLHIASTSLQVIEGSCMWRSTSPLRKLGSNLPVSARRIARLSLKAAYWASTPHLTRARWWYLRDRYDREGLRGLLAGVARSLSDTSSTAIADDYQNWIALYDTLSNEDRSSIRRHIDRLSYKPLISIVVPAYNTPAETFRQMIQSVQAQLYPHWELCIADDASPSAQIAELLKVFAKDDSRIKWMRRESNGHISAASNSALELATGEFVALLDHDDILPEHALYEVAVTLDAHPDAELVYSDEDKIDETGRRYDPYFKPDYSYDQLLGQNYISHLGVYRRSTLKQLGGFTIGAEGSQDYDLVLRLIHSEHCSPERIHHIPAILYHWRQERSGGSFSQSQLERCIKVARTSINNQLASSIEGATAVANPHVPSWNRIEWPLPSPAPLVSVIIPTRDRAQLVQQCVEGLLHRTAYDNIEIIIVDNESIEDETLSLFDALTTDSRIRVLRIDGAFNYSALNNEAARKARGEVLLLLNNDIDVMHEGWLREMVSLAVREDVGAVGAKLYYADDRIQHAGVRLGAGHFDGETGVAGHVGHGKGSKDSSYFGQLMLVRDVGAVTAACLAIRRSVFLEVGGLNETDLKVAFNDVDLCLRVRQAGYRILWTPFAELYHYESVSRGSDLAPEKVQRFRSECQYMIDTWKPQLMNDPFYNPNFENLDQEYKLAFPPRRKKPWLV
ncbi:glycosyltransferase [Tianweitania sp.]|uniref:glycosyltransferase n=1 Tax=Tianweitania sp. TaxID=2021634 RepID=UPI00289BF747|nr:glycosyltransferase [Tianweitania sp.]